MLERTDNKMHARAKISKSTFVPNAREGLVSMIAWTAAAIASGAVWFLRPQIGLDVLGNEVGILFCFLAGTFAFYVAKLIGFAVTRLGNRQGSAQAS